MAVRRRFLALAVFLALPAAYASDARLDNIEAIDVTKEFLQHYQGWLDFQEGLVRLDNPDTFRSDRDVSVFFKNEHYHNLVMMGPRAVPLLMAWYVEDVWLGDIVVEMCGLKFRGVYLESSFDGRKLHYLEEFPDTLHFGTPIQGVPLLRWWRGHKTLAGRWFRERWNQYVTYKQQGEEDLAAERLERIGEIGIDVLPLLIRMISEGHEELIPIASNVSKRPWASEKITLSEDSTREQCEAWWNRHQADYTIPDYNPLDLLRECVKE